MKKEKRKKELRCVATSWMITLLTTHKMLYKRRIKGLVYQTRTSVIFIGPGLLGFLGRGLCVYNVFGYNIFFKILRYTFSENTEVVLHDVYIRYDL